MNIDVDDEMLEILSKLSSAEITQLEMDLFMLGIAVIEVEGHSIELKAVRICPTEWHKGATGAQ
jgi:hypothetical protein